MGSHRGFIITPRARAILYVAALLAINTYFVEKLFFVEFTDNMQTNAGSFMAISRFILEHWPHLDWFPWWFNGEPFENSYSPMLHFVDAGFACLFRCSTAHAYNFVTGLSYVAGPAFLFLFAWRMSHFLETSFLAALVYSLFSPAALFHVFQTDLGSVWNPWRLRVLVHYGEGPHIAELGALPLGLLLVYFAITRRKFVWYAASACTMAFLTLVNAFGAADLAVGCVCLVAALRGRREIITATLLLSAIFVTCYLWASPFLTPTLIGTILKNSQVVEGDFHASRLFPMQCMVAAGFCGLWLLARRIVDYYLRFSLLFAYVFLAITALYALANRAALPQPNRYSLEMEMGVALALPFFLRSLFLRTSSKTFSSSNSLRIAGVALVLVLAVHQAKSYRRYARSVIQPIDITQTIEYKIAKALDAKVGANRALVSAQAGTWLNVFSNTSQMDGGHGPFNPNWDAQQAAAYAIYTGENAGSRDPEVSILWLKTFGCQAVHVSGPKSRIDGKPFRNPAKFNGALPVLWQEDDDTIYSVPQRTTSLAHVVPVDSIIKNKPIHGLDTTEVAKYVAALDNPALSPASLTWHSPGNGHIDAIVHPGQVVSVQATYDKGWIASANSRPAEVVRDGIGLTVIRANCDGPCSINLVFDGGLERKFCRLASWTVTLAILIGGIFAHRRRRRQGVSQAHGL